MDGIDGESVLPTALQPVETGIREVATGNLRIVLFQDREGKPSFFQRSVRMEREDNRTHVYRLTPDMTAPVERTKQKPGVLVVGDEMFLQIDSWSVGLHLHQSAVGEMQDGGETERGFYDLGSKECNGRIVLCGRLLCRFPRPYGNW